MSSIDSFKLTVLSAKVLLTIFMQLSATISSHSKPEALVLMIFSLLFHSMQSVLYTQRTDRYG